MEWRERGKKQYIQHDTKNKKTVKVHEMESGAYAGPGWRWHSPAAPLLINAVVWNVQNKLKVIYSRMYNMYTEILL